VPSPKSQVQSVGEPVEVSMKWTVRGAFPVIGLAIKRETGGGTEIIEGSGVGLGVSSGKTVSVGTGEVRVTDGVIVGDGDGKPVGAIEGTVHPEIKIVSIMHAPIIIKDFITRTVLYPFYSFLITRPHLPPRLYLCGAPNQARQDAKESEEHNMSAIASPPKNRPGLER
jgi:hypothetical protein